VSPYLPAWGRGARATATFPTAFLRCFLGFVGTLVGYPLQPPANRKILLFFQSMIGWRGALPGSCGIRIPGRELEEISQPAANCGTHIPTRSQTVPARRTGYA